MNENIMFWYYDMAVKNWMNLIFWPYQYMAMLDEWQQLGITLNGVRPIRC